MWSDSEGAEALKNVPGFIGINRKYSETGD